MSGLYLPGVEMPTEGNETIIRIQPGGIVLDQYGHHLAITAISVPEHGRLIDESMIPWCVDWYAGRKRYYTTPKNIEHLPTIIPTDIKTMYYPQVDGITSTVIKPQKEETE